MDINSVIFYIFATILLVSGLKVISAKNPVHAVLFLVLAFITSGCLWITLNAEFLALLLILVYVGAVMVLFLFVIMMLNIDVESLRKGFWSNLPLALILGMVVLGEMVLVLFRNPAKTGIANVNITADTTNAHQLGLALYTKYPYPVELASMILLLGLVVAVALTLRKSNKGTKYQDVAKQVNVDSKTRITILKMKSEADNNGEKQ